MKQKKPKYSKIGFHEIMVIIIYLIYIRLILFPTNIISIFTKHTKLNSSYVNLRPPKLKTLNYGINFMQRFLIIYWYVKLIIL